MIKWLTKFNLPIVMLIFSINCFVLAAHSQTQTIIPNINPNPDECPEGTDVIPTCLKGRTTPANAAELITGDLQICRCINKTKGNILSDNAPTPSNEEEIRKYKQRRVQQINDITAASTLLNSTSYSNSPSSLNNNLIGYGAGEARAQLSKNPVTIDGERIEGPSLSEAFTQIGQIPEGNASWQCVTIQEYQAHRTIPNDNKFYQMLKTTSFSPADWNENTLKSQFDSANEADRENIRQKLIFLSRNPIFKAILKAQPTETVSAELIASKQAQLLQSIQKLKPAANSSCLTRPNGCWREMQGNGKLAEFKADATAFTNDPQVHDIASAQNAKTYMDELRRLTDEGQIVATSNIPTTPEGYFAYMQSANTSLAQRCAGTNVEASCYTAFANHCVTLAVIDNRVRQGLKVSSSELTDQLFEEEAIEAKMDPNTNPAFREFNDSICLQAFANSAGRELNYFQYRAEKCEGANKIAECNDRKKLLALFLKEHSAGADEAVVSVRQSVSELVENNEYVDATAAQVATANNISESPAQIRAKFGGEYPTITPQGGIVPPSSSSVATVSPSGSSTSDSAAISTAVRDVGVVAPVSTRDNRISSQLPLDSGNQDNPQSNQNNFFPVRNPTPTFFGALNRFESGQNPVVPQEEVRINSNQQSTKETPVIPQSNKSSDSSIVTSPGASFGSVSTGQSNARSGISSVGGGGSSSAGGSTISLQPKVTPKTPQSLNFKYGLNRDGSVVQPDIQIVPVENQSLSLMLDSATVERIEKNPASLVLSSSQISEILANPSLEVPVQIKSVSGESVTVYAKKDSDGNLSYSLQPSTAGRAPASNGNIIRAKISGSVYDSVLNDPDTALNQNEDLINELAKCEDGATITLQIVSEGKRALTFEVTKKDDLLYHYRLKR